MPGCLKSDVWQNVNRCHAGAQANSLKKNELNHQAIFASKKLSRNSCFLLLIFDSYFSMFQLLDHEIIDVSLPSADVTVLQRNVLQETGFIGTIKSTLSPAARKNCRNRATTSHLTACRC